MNDDQAKSIGRAQFERLVLAANVLQKRKPEIIAGMHQEGKTAAQCEVAFATELSVFLRNARRAAITVNLSEREAEDVLFALVFPDPSSLPQLDPEVR